MIHHRVVHKESGAILGSRVEVATSLRRRTIGLMFRESMGEIDGLMVERCNSVHTCFQCFPMDVIFLSSDYTVVKVIRSMKTWRFTRMYLRARRALELPAGSVPAFITVGSMLEVTRV